MGGGAWGRERCLSGYEEQHNDGCLEGMGIRYKCGEEDSGGKTDEGRSGGDVCATRRIEKNEK